MLQEVQEGQVVQVALGDQEAPVLNKQHVNNREEKCRDLQTEVPLAAHPGL